MLLCSGKNLSVMCIGIEVCSPRSLVMQLLSNQWLLLIIESASELNASLLSGLFLFVVALRF